MLAELKQCFLEAYDDNRDGKIDIREVNMCIYHFFFFNKKQSQKFNIFKTLIAPQGAGKLLGKWKKSDRSCSYRKVIYLKEFFR